jgi:dolichol-phosphate mannosyltransferase
VEGMKDLRAAIILPTYNECDNIVELIQALHGYLEPEGLDYEIVVVDDSSPDGTADVVRGTFGNDSRVNLMVRTAERGLASAIRHGIESCNGDVVVVMDTDFNHDPKVVPQLIKLLEYYDVIIGSRFVMGGGMEDRARYFSSFLYNMFIRLMFRTQIQDNLSGFFAMYRSRLQEMDMWDSIFYGYGDYFIRLLMVAWKRRFSMLEVPVYYRLRTRGHSKTQFFSILIQYTAAILKLRLKLFTGRLR